MTDSDDRIAFAQARAVLVARGSARTVGSSAMRAYLVLFIILIVVIPVVRALVVALSAPLSISLITAETTPAVVAVGAVALVLAAGCVGSTRGAIVPRPAFVHFVVQSPLSARVTLRWPLVAAHILTAAAFATAAAVVCGALAVAGLTVNPLAATLFIAAAAAYGMLLVAAWLAGQASASVRVGAWIALGATVVASAVIAVSGGATEVAEWMRAATETVATGDVVLTTVGLAVSIVIAWVCAAGTSALLARLRSTELMTQGQIWASAGVMARTGDVRGSLERIRMPARHRPRRVGLRNGCLAWLIVKRDATGTVRHPIRLGIGICSALLAGVLVALALSGGPAIGAFIGAVSGMLGYLSAGAFTDGVRAHADNIGAPALFGTAAHPLAMLHLVFPAIVSCVVVKAGAILAFASVHSVLPIALIAAPVFALVMVALRGVSAVKGPLPVTLLLPVPTPVGDVSILFALAWSFDGLLIALSLGACLALGVATSVPALVLSAAVLLSAFAIWGRKRLQRLRT
jgi:hypothetical protein